MDQKNWLIKACNLHDEAIRLRHQGRLIQAEKLAKKSLKIFEFTHETEHTDIASVLVNLGRILEIRGKLKHAQNAFERATNILSKLPEMNIDMLRLRVQAIRDLGAIYRSLGKYEASERAFHLAIQIGESMFGEMDLDLSAIWNNLGMLYKSLGNYEKAEVYYLKALSINDALLGEKHLYSAVIYHNLAVLEQARGRLSDAERYAWNAVEIRKSELGSDHPEQLAGIELLSALIDAQRSNGSNISDSSTI
ncbi:MAG: tetratricopeptide repeat protein [Calditrichaeota bacterium]|nr:tetratricopeptide repeat protein [Calditrichota bacterium]MCB9069439.1 tetratricopeptide repeat protein [Calditrichia bacterium]